MAAKKTRIKLGFHSGTGQYRKFIKGKMHYFGSDEKTALARYSFFIETGLVYKAGFRQFCRVDNGHILPIGRTIEEARRNLAATNETEAVPSSPAPLAIVIRSVRDVGDAYCEWLHQHKRSAESIRDTVRAFHAMISYEPCGDLPIQRVDKHYFLRWRNYCHHVVESGTRQPTWANKRLSFVKAAFKRCQVECWISIPALEDTLSPLQTISGPPIEKAVFEPHELRMVIEAADLWLKAAIMLAINTGIGNSDLGRAKWEHFVKKKIGDKTETRFIMPRGKTWGRRRTPLWPETVDVLERWKTERSQKGLPTGEDGFVWTNRYGTPIVYSAALPNSKKSLKHGPVALRDNLSPHFSTLLDSLGLRKPNLGFYSIRHSGSTWASDYGDEDTAVKEGNQFYLGNAPGEVWKNYSHGVPPSLRRTINVIHKALFDK